LGSVYMCDIKCRFAIYAIETLKQRLPKKYRTTNLLSIR
jgi:hypothetical protein